MTVGNAGEGEGISRLCILWSDATETCRAGTGRTTDGQRARLERLWFVYGNHGSKATMENHGFIQGFLERGADERDFYRPTQECLAAVDAVLSQTQDGGR